MNELHRPIPSGRMPGRWGLYVAVLWTLLSVALSVVLGPWGFGAAVVGLMLAWAPQRCTQVFRVPYSFGRRIKRRKGSS